MQPDTSPIPHTLAQWFGLVLATILAAICGWWARRKREPIEIDKLRAETKSITVAAEVSQSTFHLETLKELRTVIDKAEQRRYEWQEREEQLRNQIIFWRGRAEELDGALADAQETNWKNEAQSKLDAAQIKKLKAVLDFHQISYAELDQPHG